MFTLPDNITCGYYDCSELGNLSVSPKRTVDRFEIELYLEDGLEVYINGKAQPIKKNHILIAKPGQERYSKLPFQTLYVKFSANDEIAKKLMAAPQYFNSSHSEQIANIMRELILSNEQDNKILFYSILLSLIHLVLSDTKLVAVTDYHVISKAKRYIETHYHEKIKLDDIAKHSNLSPIYFHNLFTVATGKTPHQFLTEYRIENAKKMLWNTECILSDIATNCGYSSQQHFSTIFKKETGLTPNEYRKMFQQKYSY